MSLNMEGRLGLSCASCPVMIVDWTSVALFSSGGSEKNSL